jgi:hypothetical protein
MDWSCVAIFRVCYAFIVRNSGLQLKQKRYIDIEYEVVF